MTKCAPFVGAVEAVEETQACVYSSHQKSLTLKATWDPPLSRRHTNHPSNQGAPMTHPQSRLVWSRLGGHNNHSHDSDHPQAIITTECRLL